MVSTKLKHLSQIGNLPQIGVKPPTRRYPPHKSLCTTLSRWFSRIFPGIRWDDILAVVLYPQMVISYQGKISKTNPFQSIQTSRCSSHKKCMQKKSMDSRKNSWQDVCLFNLCLENPSFSFWLFFEGSSFLPASFPLLEASGTSCSNKDLSPCNGDNTKTHGRTQLCNLHRRKERFS